MRPAWPVVSDDADFVPVGPWNTDGLLFISPLRVEQRRAYARQLQADGFPVVFVGTGDGTPAVVADSEMGFRHALAHLSAHGHRRVAYIAGDPLDPGDSLARLNSFRRLREGLGLDPDEALVEPGRHSERGGYEAMQPILARGRPFTAVLASNDSSALGAMRALAEAGLRVPEDVAVVGFDDTPEAAANVPPLATVRYPLFETGRKAVERLVDVILGTPGLPDTIAIPTRLRRPPLLRLPAARRRQHRAAARRGACARTVSTRRHTRWRPRPSGRDRSSSSRPPSACAAGSSRGSWPAWATAWPTTSSRA